MNKEKWEIKKLGEVFETSSGGTPSSKKTEYYENGTISWLRSGEVNQRFINQAELKITELGLSNSSAKIFPKGTVLIAMYGATVGQVGVLNFSSATNQAICGILPNEKVENSFLYYFLKSKKEAFIKQAIGGAQPNISQQKIKDTLIPIPPLSTQEKIVSELDTLHRLKELQEQQLAELDNLAQSTFYHLFGDPIENEKGWEVKKLGEFTRIINGRAYKQEELLKEGKTPVLRVGNFFSNKDFYYSNLELDKDKYCDYGDLLYAWSASFGAKIWDGGKVIYHYHIWKIEINESICNKIFLFNILNLKTNYLKEQTHGIAMLHLTKSGMEDTNFILPPLSLQTQFSERIEKIETQKELIKQSIGETQLLIDYTMDKYFG